MQEKEQLQTIGYKESRRSSWNTYHGLTDLDNQFELVAVNSENPFFRFKNSPGENLSTKESNPSHTLIIPRAFEEIKFSEITPDIQEWVYGAYTDKKLSCESGC